MSLSKYEIACVTAGVPATGDPILDHIIILGVRYKTASEFLAKNAQDRPLDLAVADAVRAADALLAKFQKSSTSPEETQSPLITNV